MVAPRLLLGIAVTLAVATPVAAMERLCDTAFEDCRAPLRHLIQNERHGIDVAFWFMTDMRYVADLVDRWRAGVPVRVIVDPRSPQAGNATALERLRDAGIPMRYKTSSGVMHWKMMLFAGQNVVQFSGANYSAQAFVPIEPYRNYVDEVIYFTSRPPIVNSFRTRFDDVWTSTSGFANYANVHGPLQRHYPTFSIDPEMSFGPWESFRSRSVSRYRAEREGVDAIIYRITDRAHTDALIEAMTRGVSVRILTEPEQYRDPTRLWHAWNVDRLYLAGAQLRHRLHAGLTHQKLTLLVSQRMAIFGSSNWTGPSADSQLEHNLFTTDSSFYSWSRHHFDRKWHNLGPSPETQPFQPLPPDRPVLESPAHGAAGQPATIALAWYAGPWAHKYDLYLGTDPSNMVKVLDDHELGPNERVSDRVRWTVRNLQPGATYYWFVVSRTMANLSRTSDTWSFTVDPRATVSDSALPLGWVGEDVGTPALAGSSSHSSGRFTVQGAGRDIWGTADEFHYVYRPISGNVAIEARVTSLQGPEAWTKAGVMLRETLNTRSTQASMFVTGGNGLAFQRRTDAGGSSTHTAAGGGAAPAWVRLERIGDTISAYTSANGTSWTLVETIALPMGNTLYAGLAVTSRNASQSAVATFERVTITPLPANAPPPPISGPGGSPSSLVSPGNGQRLAVPRTGTWTVPQTERRSPGS